MLGMRTNFYYVSSAFVFASIGLLFALQTHYSWEFMFASYIMPLWLSYTIVGASFLMAFSSLKYLK